MPHLARNESHQEPRGFAARGLPIHRRRIIRALIIESDLAVVELCLQELKKAQFAISSDVAQTREECINRLRSQADDVGVAGAAIDEWTGVEARRRRQHMEP